MVLRCGGKMAAVVSAFLSPRKAPFLAAAAPQAQRQLMDKFMIVGTQECTQGDDSERNTLALMADSYFLSSYFSLSYFCC